MEGVAKKTAMKEVFFFICFEFVACYFALIQILVTSALFFFLLLRVMSHPVQNPCITKQLDQKPPLMQQGSNAPYLLPR